MNLNAALNAFVRTVEKGSVTGAARDLGISQPAVTKHLKSLENHLNARLIERTSRSIRPTTNGLTLYEVSRSALASIDAACESVRRDMGNIEGNLRIHTPSCLGFQHLHRLAMEFQDAHPGVTVDLCLDNDHVDLVRENFDLALRYGAIETQGLIMRRIGWIKRILVATPEYLERYGSIDTPTDLADADFVATYATVSSRNVLTLLGGDGPIEVFVKPRIKTNSAQVLRSSILSSRGICPVQVILVSEELEQGKLVRVLPDFEVQSTEVSIIYASTRFMRPVVRAFTDFIVPAIRSLDGIETRRPD